MANHVTNILIISDTGGTSIAEIQAVFINSSTNKIDFNVVMPSPKCLDYFEPHSGIISLANAKLDTPISDHPFLGEMETKLRELALERENGMSEQDKKDVHRAIENYEECGYLYWLDWKNANWGTKSNAYGQPDGYPEDTMEYTFDTAWSHPFNIIVTISEKLPNVVFNVQFADEDLGSNVGCYLIKNTMVLSDDIAEKFSDMNGDQRAYYMEMAWNIKHPDVDPASWGYDENWDYHEEIEEEYERNN